MTEHERERILKIIESAISRVEAIHPYKVYGDFETYCKYNEGWSDCADRIRGEIALALQGEEEKTVGDFLMKKNYH